MRKSSPFARPRRTVAGLLAGGVWLAAAAGCHAPGGPGSKDDISWGSGNVNPARPDAAVDPTPSPADDAAAPPPPPAVCLPARGSEKLFPRMNVIALPDDPDPASAPPPPPPMSNGRPYFAADLFTLFDRQCGACHVKSELGMFKIAQATFAVDMGKNQMRVLTSMRSNDVTTVMPPPVVGGKPASQREPGDAAIELLELLDLWFKQDRKSVFTIPSATPTIPAPTPATPDPAEKAPSYLVSETLATQLTNIGSCVPNRTMVGNAAVVMDKLDTFFAAAKELPDKLADTDLTSLDGAVLAQRGVIAFAPGYPLWSDGSAKWRAVRVPRGQSIKFDKATQRFDIPANTRFYKTFLKHIVDVNGNESFRKIETRLIVSRPDGRQADGRFEPRALFGTYLWNDEETEAVLVKDKLRDGSVFADRLLTYIVDEPKAKKIRDSMPVDLSRALEDDNPGVTRRYAIPGKERCIACHMGAENASFVLGFTPLQLNRRPLGEGGVYEPTGEDELNQLQRLIDYDVITGIASAAEVLPLETSQGTRKPRNEYELKAQAYVLGNCAHCHNPRGFPSVNAPDLVEVLDFLPSQKGGIFQFPLDRMSPLRKRGEKQDIPMPYITPSLRDFKSKPNPEPQIWKPKFVDCEEDGSTAMCDADKKGKVQFIEAPWRSLIYRNVDSPFIYAEDYTIFPHMPRDTAGFDYRAPMFLGDWMVSIPAKRKSTKISEDEIVEPDTEPQPYVEVLPSDPDYAAALKEVTDPKTGRLVRYHNGKRYNFRLDTTDIVDHQVLKGKQLVPVDGNIFGDAKREKLVMPSESVPDKGHFVVTDLTDAPGGWSPRRPDWQTALIKPAPSPRTDIDVPTLLKTLTVSEKLKAFARKPFAMGFWKAKDTCDLGKNGVRKVSEVPQADRPSWMRNEAESVYEVTPGEAVFQNICINCHGQQADSKGLLATAVAEMTGGDARVANFKAGLFGPPESPGKNLEAAFAPFAKTNGATAEDWAQRYMIWMALGGTTATLPSSVLSIVGTTPVVGARRSGMTISATPNMLETAQQLCVRVLGVVGVSSDSTSSGSYFGDKEVNWAAKLGLIDGNGDAELWARLCSLDNRPVVRVFTPTPRNDGLELLEKNRYWGDGYPKDAPVMNHRGEIQIGIQPDNLAPTCLFEPEGSMKAVSDALQKDFPVGPAGKKAPLPYCPKSWTNEPGPDVEPKWKFTYRDDTVPPGDLLNISALQWAARGAMNAGMAVFLYLQDLESCKVSPTPPYNRCEDLGKSMCKR